MIRVLHVFGTVALGGAESRIMDLYKHIDRTQVQFDFLVHCDPGKTGKRCPTSEELMKVRTPDYFDSLIKELGGHIYCLPRFKGTNFIEYKIAAERFFASHEGIWTVVQGHMTSTASIYIPIAKKSGIRTTITHVRSGGTDPGIKGVATNLLRKGLRKEGAVDYLFSCTKAAAISVYGQELVDAKKVYIIPNAIDAGKFKYNEDTRIKLRRELGLENSIVIGHVGRFHYAKNHEFLIKVFAELVGMLSGGNLPDEYLLLKNLSPKLMLLGEGPLMDGVKSEVKDLGIEDNVLFMNNKKDVYNYYQAMDYFLFPSRYEGLPGTVVEAQASGLMCLVSDSVTQEVDLTELVSRMSLNKSPREWALKILSDLLPNDRSVLPLHDRVQSSDIVLDSIRSAGYDVSTQAEVMKKFYLNGSFEK